MPEYKGKPKDLPDERVGKPWMGEKVETNVNVCSRCERVTTNPDLCDKCLKQVSEPKGKVY